MLAYKSRRRVRRPWRQAPGQAKAGERVTQAQRQTLRFLATVGAYLLLTAGMLWVAWQVRHLFAPFFVAFVIAIALAPVVDRLEARGWPRGLATGFVYLGLFAALGGLLFVLVPLVGAQVQQIAADLRTRFAIGQPVDLSHMVARQLRVFGREHEIPTFVIAPLIEQAKNSAAYVTRGLEILSGFLVNLAPNLILLFLVPLIAFYAVVDYHRIFAKMLLLTPKESRDNVRAIASEVTVVFGKYLRGLGFICLLDAAAATVVLLLFPATRPFAPALGLIAGLLYAIPYLGAIVSTGLIALVALAAPGGSVAGMLWVTLSMVALHQLFFDQVLAPRILGGHVGLHPILSIFALLAGSTLAGVGGMLLAVPVAASVQVVVLHLVPRLRKRIEVTMQTEAPATADTQETAALLDGKTDALARGRISVTAGEGVVGQVGGGRGGNRTAGTRRANNNAEAPAAAATPAPAAEPEAPRQQPVT